MRVPMTAYLKIDLNTEVDLPPALVCTRRPGRDVGLLTGNDFWAGADAPDDAEFVLAVVPAQADPEAAMARVRALI